MPNPTDTLNTPVGPRPAPGRASLAGRLRSASLRPVLRWESGLAVVVALIVIIGSAASPDFLTGNNLFNLGLSNGEVAIMTLPMTLIIISGEIDLSVASILGMSSALLGYLWVRGWPLLAIFVTIAVVGIAAGAINGLLVTRLRLPSLAVTIGTLALYRGVATILLGPNTVASFPAAYTNLGVNAVPFTGNDMTYSTLIFIAAAIIFGVVLHATPLGRSIYAMGASAEAAQFAGIRVKRIKTGLYMVSGLICSLAGVLWTFRLDTAVQNNGLGMELNVVAIVLLAGVSIFGGKGSIIGVVLAVLAFAGIQNALLLTNFNQEATGIVTGALLLASVFLPNAARWLSLLRATRRLSPNRQLPDGLPRRQQHASPTRRVPTARSRIERIQRYEPETGKEARARARPPPCRHPSPGGLHHRQLVIGSRRIEHHGIEHQLQLQRVRRAQDRPQGLHHPEEPRQLLLHHRR
jgi:rhamnose transport system permease protein